jgi:hypothetical protein
MKQIRRITAMLMVMMLIFTSSGVTSLAANESSSGATNPNQKGDAGITDYDPNCTAVMRPAWLVYIEKVNNTRTGEPTMSTDANASMTTFSQCKWSAVDEMLYDYPKEFMKPDNSLVEHSFIVVNKGSASFNMNDVHVVMPADNSRPKATAVYAISGNPPASNVGTGTTVISDDILNDPEKIESFRNGAWTYSDYEMALNHVTSGSNSIEEAKKNFVNCFKDVGSITTRIDSTRGNALNNYPQYADVIRNSITLNILAVISQLCPDPSYYTEYITDYLQNQNRDESSSFYVPVIIAGFICSQGGNESPAFYSLPAYLEKAYGGSLASDVLSLPEGTDFGDYGSGGSAYENNFWNYYELSNQGKVSKYYANRVGSWFNYDHGSSSGTGFKGQAYTCMPTDEYDLQKGNLGYTYFAFGGSGAAATDGIGQFKITASSAQKTVAAKGTSVAAQLDVDLKCDATQIQQYWDTYAAEKAKGFTLADLIVEYSMTPVKGSGTSSPLIDSVLGEGNLSGGNKVTLSNMTYETLIPYLKGQKTIQVADSNIIINESTTNKYLANVTLKFSDKSYKLYAKGKTIESTYVGSEVSWSLGVDTPNKFHYYSAIGKPGAEDNYVEIKEGSPGHESWEAMAGVPTTEDLYVGFGATEFMLNFDGEWKQNPEVTRTYTWSYTVSNCMEDDELCEWSCPGHTVTVPSHKIQDEIKDNKGHVIQPEVWCGGASNSGSCSPGSVTVTATSFNCLIIRFAYFGLFSDTQASMPEVSKIVIVVR